MAKTNIKKLTKGGVSAMSTMKNPVVILSLAVIVMVAMLLGFASISSGLDKTILVTGSLVIVVLFIGVVAFLAVKKPDLVWGVQAEAAGGKVAKPKAKQGEDIPEGEEDEPVSLGTRIFNFIKGVLYLPIGIPVSALLILSADGFPMLFALALLGGVGGFLLSFLVESSGFMVGVILGVIVYFWGFPTYFAVSIAVGEKESDEKLRMFVGAIYGVILGLIYSYTLIYGLIQRGQLSIEHYDYAWYGAIPGILIGALASQYSFDNR